MELRVWDDFWIGRNSADRADCEVKLVQHSCSSVSSLTDGKREEGFLFFFQFLDKWSCLGEMICEWRLAKIHWTGQTLRWSLCSVLYLPVYLSCWAGTGMAQQTGMGVNHQDTLAVPPMPKHSGLNEDLVKILRENLLQPERPRGHRRSPSTISPRLSPRNSPRLLRRMLLNNNIHKQRRFTVAHTWWDQERLCPVSVGWLCIWLCLCFCS